MTIANVAVVPRADVQSVSAGACVVGFDARGSEGAGPPFLTVTVECKIARDGAPATVLSLMATMSDVEPGIHALPSSLGTDSGCSTPPVTVLVTVSDATGSVTSDRPGVTQDFHRTFTLSAQVYGYSGGAKVRTVACPAVALYADLVFDLSASDFAAGRVCLEEG